MEISLDVNNDNVVDFVVIGADFGYLTTGTFDGRPASAVFNAATGALNIQFLASAPSSSSTILLPVFNTQIGVSAANPRFRYSAAAFSLRGESDGVNGIASFNAYNNAI